MASDPNYQAEYYRANRDRILARVKAREIAKREEVLAYKKIYRAKNIDRIKASQKEHYLANKQRYLARAKARATSKRDEVEAYKKQWWKENRERQCAAKREHYKANTDVIRAKQKAAYDANPEPWKALARKYRARKIGVSCGVVDYKSVLMKSNGLCGICNKPLDLFGIHIDHIVPLARGGAHVESNLQAAHAFCNLSKGARESSTWR